MRWKFHDPENQVERAEREQILGKIDRWWADFEMRVPEIENALTGGPKAGPFKRLLAGLMGREAPFEFSKWVGSHLDGIANQLAWEVAPGLKAGRRFILTAESHYHLQPLIDVMVARAPRVAGWEFGDGRLAWPLEAVAAYVDGVSRLSVEGALVHVGQGENRKVDLTYFLPACKSEKDDRAEFAAVVASSRLLGEERMKEIGFIKALPISQASGRATTPLAQLAEAVDRQVVALRSDLPAAPWHDPSAGEDGPEGAVISAKKSAVEKLKASPAEDYAGRSDLLTAQTAYSEMFAAAHSGLHFSSRRFSRFGETLCYAKLDGRGACLDVFPDRVSIQDALNEVLKPEKVGAVVGGGTGLIYSYVDLALTDLDRALPLIRQALQDGKVSKRSWLHFFDSELRDEWIGIWPDTPAPPVA